MQGRRITGASHAKHWQRSVALSPGPSPEPGKIGAFREMLHTQNTRNTRRKRGDAAQHPLTCETSVHPSDAECGCSAATHCDTPAAHPVTPAEPQKFDAEKLPLHLIPPELLFATARGLAFGARKYSPGNWATGSGFDHSRLYGALQRHLNAYWSGEDIDPDSGNHHLDHAACMLAFLIAHIARGKGTDDRVTVGAAAPNLRPPAN